MTKVTFIQLALVATPFLLFFLYRAVVSARRAEQGATFNETPYQILFLSGAALSLIVLFASVLLRHTDADPRDQVYVPPRVVDGEVQPGVFISREEAIARGLIDDGDPEPYLHPDAPAEETP